MQVAILVSAKKRPKYVFSRSLLILFAQSTVQALLNRNAKVYIASRSKVKADAAIQELKEATGHEPLFLQLDLASLASVRQAAEEFLRYAFT